MKKNVGVTTLVQDIWGDKVLLTFGVLPCFLETGYAFYGVSDVKFNKNIMTNFRSNICAFYACIPGNRNIWRKIFQKKSWLAKELPHKNLTKNLRVLYQLIYYLSARKKWVSPHSFRRYQRINIANAPSFTPVIAFLATYTIILDNVVYIRKLLNIPAYKVSLISCFI